MNLVYLLKNSRIHEPVWMGYALIALIGYILSNPFDWDMFFIISIAVFLSTSAIYQINNLFDCEDDKYSSSTKNMVACGKVSKKEAFIFGMFLYMLSIVVVYPFSRLSAFILFLINLWGCFLYSAPPIRLKTRPPLDIVTHMIFWGALFVPFGAFLGNVNMKLLLPVFFFFLMLSMSFQSYNLLRDYEADLRSNTKTSAVKYGKHIIHGLYHLSFFSTLLMLLLFKIMKLLNSSITFYLGLMLVGNYLYKHKKNTRLLNIGIRGMK